MIAYNYNKVTGEFSGETDCQIDPLESKKQKKNIYLLPGGATFEKPSEIGENEIQVFENNKWSIKKDYRNIIYYDKSTKEKHIITTINELPLDSWTTKEPLTFDETCKWSKTEWIIDEEKVTELETIKQKEILIQGEIRKQAIEKLIADGKLTEDGELIKV